MSGDRHEELVRRFERLESRYRRWRRAGLGATGVAVAVLAYGAYSHAQRPGEPPAAEPGKLDGRPLAIDAAGMRTNYTNFFRITGTPDEVFLDFGIQSQVDTPAGPEPVKITDRMVMNFYTAKKLQAAVNTVVARHEGAFGELQLDPNKRVKPRGDRQ